MRSLRGVFTLCVLVSLGACQNLRPSQMPQWNASEAHDFGATYVAFSPDGLRLASGGFTGTVKIWQIESGKLLSSHQLHASAIRGLKWIDQNQILSMSESGQLKIWDVATSKLIQQRLVEKITASAFMDENKQGPTNLRSEVDEHNAQTVLIGHADGLVQRIRVPELNTVAQWRAPRHIYALAIKPDSGEIAAATRAGEVYLFKPDLTRPVVLAQNVGRVYELRFNPKSQELAAATWFHLVVWDLATQQSRIVKTEHLGAIVSIDYHPQGRELVSLGRHTDANLRLIDPKNGVVQRRLAAHQLCGWHVRFSKDGRFIASASEDESVRIYNNAIEYVPTWKQPN